MTWHDAVKIWLAKAALDFGIFLLIVLLAALAFGLYYLRLTWLDWKRKRRKQRV